MSSYLPKTFKYFPRQQEASPEVISCCHPKTLKQLKITNLRTARCVKMMGKGVVKVVHRCDDAKENNNLGEIP